MIDFYQNWTNIFLNQIKISETSDVKEYEIRMIVRIFTFDFLLLTLTWICYDL